MVRLGRAASEPIAHLLAQAIERAGLGVRVAGLDTIASQIVPGSSQHTIEVLVYEDEYERAKATAEDALERAIAPGRGDGVIAPGRGAQGFTFDPAPGGGSLWRNPGALIGLLVLVGLPTSCLGYAVYELALGLIGEGSTRRRRPTRETRTLPS
ncbi:MAG: hypothetical protein ACIARR_06865 [Phycisphaerales bacterium JB059]